MLPSQLTPSPVYPGLQVHVKEPLVLVQNESSWQLCSPVSHSSTNQQVEVSYKNSIDLSHLYSQFSLFQLFNSCFDYLFFFLLAQTTDIVISWLKFIEKTLVSVLRSRNVASLKSLLSYRVARLHSWYASEFWLSVQVFRALLECHHQRWIIFCFFFRLRQRLFWAPLRLDGKFFFHSKVPFILFFSFSFFLPFSFSGARRGARIRERIWTVLKIICLASTRISRSIAKSKIWI